MDQYIFCRPGQIQSDDKIVRFFGDIRDSSHIFLIVFFMYFVADFFDGVRFRNIIRQFRRGQKRQSPYFFRLLIENTPWPFQRFRRGISLILFTKRFNTGSNSIHHAIKIQGFKSSDDKMFLNIMYQNTSGQTLSPCVAEFGRHFRNGILNTLQVKGKPCHRLRRSVGVWLRMRISRIRSRPASSVAICFTVKPPKMW